MSDNSPMMVIENALKEVLDSERADIVQESLAQVRMMFQVEDHGWSKLFGQFGDGSMPGADLPEIKEMSKTIREYLVGNPLIKRGGALRSSYIWSKGVIVPEAHRDPSKPGAVTALQRFYADDASKRYLFSSEAQEEMERCAFSDGLFVIVLDDVKKKVLYPLQVSDISSVYVNPDYAGEVWGYLREWDRVEADGKTSNQQEWILTDKYPKAKRPTSIKVGTKNVRVAQSKTAIDQKFNSQQGWTMGIPDAVAAVVWARIYSELMEYGRVMTESLSRFALKVTAGSKKGAQNAGVQIGGGGSAGQTAVLGAGNDLVPLSSAGKSYDFKGLTQVAAQVATAIEVSTIHITSDTSAAGSAYGSAQNLDAPTKRAMVMRQNLWGAFLSRVLKHVTGKFVEVTFPPLDDDVYRPLQSAVLAWNTGLIHADEARELITRAIGNTVMHDAAPEGVMLPNNEESLARKDVDADGLAVDKTAASGDQGIRNKTGGAGNDKNDIRQDTLNSEVLSPEQMAILVENIRELL